jgi:hypothetical protein
VTTPVRVQRKRTKGYKMPPNTVSVTRPGALGNPFRVGIYHDDPAECVAIYRRCISQNPVPDDLRKLWERYGGDAYFLENIANGKYLKEVRGKNVACYCGLDKPCHGDVVLELANA